MRRTEDEILNDYRYVCTTPDPSVSKLFKEEYPPKGFNIDNYYVDQAGVQSTYVADRSISNIYLPLGLKRIESWYIREIQRWNSSYLLRGGYHKEELIDFIKGNPHLHNVIKTNLIHNLKNR